MCIRDSIYIVVSYINNWVDVHKSDVGYKILNDVNKEHTRNSKEDNDNKEISINDDTICSKDVWDMLDKCSLWSKKQKEADLSKWLLWDRCMIRLLQKEGKN